MNVNTFNMSSLFTYMLIKREAFESEDWYTDIIDVYLQMILEGRIWHNAIYPIYFFPGDHSPSVLKSFY